MRTVAVLTRTALAFTRNPWQAQEPRMNRLLSLFKRRPTIPTSASFFSTNSPRLSLPQQSNMSPAGSVHPVSSSPSLEKFENFDLIERVKLGISDITVSSWRSRVTGLRVVHLDYEGERTFRRVPSFLLRASVFTVPIAPIVNGYFVVATESTQILTSAKSCLTHDPQFSMILAVRTP